MNLNQPNEQEINRDDINTNIDENIVAEQPHLEQPAASAEEEIKVEADFETGAEENPTEIQANNPAPAQNASQSGWYYVPQGQTPPPGAVPASSPVPPPAPGYVYVQQPGYYRPPMQDPELVAEKKNIRRAGNAIGLGYLLTIVFNFGISIVGIVLAIVFGPAVTEIIGSAVFLQYVQIIASILMFTLPFIIALYAGGQKFSSLSHFGKPKEKGWILPCLLVGYGFCVIANIAGNYINSFLDALGLGYEPNIQYPSGIFGFLIMVISAAVVPALVEEFAYRGVVFGLLRRFGEGFAVIASAILFGLMHGNMDQIPFAIIVGLVLGMVVAKTGSIWPSVLLHFTNNFVAVVLHYLTSGMDLALASFVSIVWIGASILALVIGIIISTSRGKDMFTINSETPSVLNFQQKLGALFSSPVVILALVATAIQVLITMFAR